MRGNSAPTSALTFDQLEDSSLRLPQNQNSHDIQSIDMWDSILYLCIFLTRCTARNFDRDFCSHYKVKIILKHELIYD
eukprot:UN24736